MDRWDIFSACIINLLEKCQTSRNEMFDWLLTRERLIVSSLIMQDEMVNPIRFRIGSFIKQI